MKLSSLLATVLVVSQPFMAHTVFAQVAPPPPAADVEMTYYDRHKIDVSNLRDFYDGLLIADMMIHADAMFDAGPLPTRTTAAHIEELRRYYSDREIQEILSLLITSGWLTTAMQSQLTVTDRLSMAWALRYLTPVGWKPVAHIGLPHEQHRFHMTEVTDFAIAQMNSGEIIDGTSEWLDVNVPLAVDADGDGVEDGFDGFPNDPTRWADTDRDGVEVK